MMMIAPNGASKPDQGDANDQLSATFWTDQQTAYALFLNNACVRLEIVADGIGIEPDLIDEFVRDVLVTAHRARHTRSRGREREAWIEAIARNLGRKRRFARRRASLVKRSFGRFVGSLGIIGIEGTETQRLPSEVMPKATTM